MKDRPTVFWVPPLFDDDGVQVSSGIGSDGKEYPDPLNLVVPVSEQNPNDMLAQIQRIVQSEFLRQKADEEGFDTPEEADDFVDEDDDYEITPYQRSLMEKDLNPDPALLRGAEPGQVKKEAATPPGSVPPPSDVSKPVVSSGTLGQEIVEPPLRPVSSTDNPRT